MADNFARISFGYLKDLGVDDDGFIRTSYLTKYPKTKMKWMNDYT